jgi:hypothetical protein
LRLWSWADDYDLLLHMDSDVLVLGNIESALDAFAPNGTAPHDLGAVRDIINGGRTFNRGFMAIQPSRSRFEDMMRAGRQMRFNGRYAEQGWLNGLKRTACCACPCQHSIG